MTKAVTTPAAGVVGMMERLAANPDIPTDKLRELLEMQKEIMSIEAERAFADAMAKVQAEIPMVIRRAQNSQTNSLYAKHEAIAMAIKPVYTSHGFSLTFSEGKAEKPDEIRIAAVLRHGAGHSEHGHIDLPPDSAGIKGSVNKTPVHAKGSTMSYGRRYLTLMMFDIATGDDNDAQSQTLETISEKQVAELERLIEKVGADKAAFLAHIKADTLEDIPVKSFNACKGLLEAKGRQTKKAAEA